MVGEDKIKNPRLKLPGCVRGVVMNRKSRMMNTPGGNRQLDRATVTP